MARSKNFTRSGTLNIIFQIAFLLVFYFAGRDSCIDAGGAWRNILLVFIVLIPSAIWTLFFYFQDRIEPEPASYVVIAFLAGMAGASLFALPLEREVFNLDLWLYQSKAFLVLGSIFVIGSVTGFVFYLPIRYGFFPTREFDEPVDGMVYGAFIGSGFAAVKSIMYLSGHSEFTLFSIAYTATTNILIHASIGSLVGYIIGRSKFLKKDPQPASILAIVVGMLLIGIYRILNEIVFLTGSGNAFWYSFILTLVFAAVILILVCNMMRKLTEKSLHKDVRVKARADYLVFLFFIVLIIAGGISRNRALQPSRFESTDYGIAFSYPSHRVSPVPIAALPGTTPGSFSQGAVLFNARGNEAGEFTFSVKARRESIDIAEINTVAYIGNLETINLYAGEIDVGGKKGMRLKYSYAETGKPEGEDFSEIYWVCTDIIPSAHYTYVITFRATPLNYDKAVKIYEYILESVEWING